MNSISRINSCLSIVAVILVTLMLHGCGSPKLEPIDGGAILAFGDSLTAGVGVSKENSYPSVLAELSGLNVINAGVPGETTDQGLKRLPIVLDRTNPALIILIEGGNDILQNRSQSEIKNNLKKMIELAQRRDIQVVLIGVPRKALFSDSAPLYETLAENYKLVFDDALIAELERSPSLKSDQVHFNATGYRKMARSIYELLVENGAV